MDNVEAAKKIIPLLDLTSLSENDTEYSIADFCHRAQTPYGNTAAVCIYNRFLTVAKQELKGSKIKLATVVNFPKGGHDLNKLRKEISSAIESGADEIDAVFPYKDFLNKEYHYCSDFLQTATTLCKDKTLKIILETGELKTAALIRKASEIVLENGADFIKTSTGKSKISATPQAANIMLETIKASAQPAGFKASGGIKTTTDAKQYLILAESIMGPEWVTPDTFRIGASALLDDLLLTINQGY
ncbi:MAG: deoxyribose-phosphate aldolase [Alphaproteobacteria bacterium]|nr:deoxyribose-phosphate aldolase [Alphaproteobacteria bacterium]MBQ8677763.1 deoxyribose-phosphate aldolase [Alphaproteobacteria bacterium]